MKRNPKPTRSLRALAACAVLALSACGGEGGGRRAPDFALPDLGGRTVTLSSRAGRAVLVNFWAPWCDSCKEELPALSEIHRRHGGKAFEILAIDVDEDAALKAPAFVAAHKIPFAVLCADRKTLDAYAVRGLPASFLIDPDGTIVRRYLGPLDANKLENDILTALNRRPS